MDECLSWKHTALGSVPRATGEKSKNNSFKYPIRFTVQPSLPASQVQFHLGPVASSKALIDR